MIVQSPMAAATLVPTADLVTVVVPARDEEANIDACLRSILGQDWPDLQVIVVDGKSRDGTAAIVRRYAMRDRRVEALVNHDGRITMSDSKVIEAAVDRVEAAHPELIGGAGIYPARPGHGPFSRLATARRDSRARFDGRRHSDNNA